MIREAVIADCGELGKLHTMSWQQTYSGMVPQPYLDALDPIARGIQWREILLQNTSSVWLHFHENTLAGFVGFGICSDEDAESNWGEIGALYYLKKYWGKGMAPVLLEKTMTNLHDSGYPIVTLWVLRQNERAKAFYQKHGFNFDGKEKEDQREKFILSEHRMRYA